MATKASLNLVFVNCCVCESRDATVIGKGEDFEYHTSPDTFSAMRCNSCGLVYLNPRPAINELEKIYPPTYHAYDFSKINFGVAYKVRTRLETWRLLNHCRNLPDDARILDVGCGDGFHLNLLRKFGKKTWSLEGVDIDRHAVEVATRSGLKVHLGTVEEIGPPKENYDLVLMIQTIEHVEKPDEVLHAIYKLLREGGRLVIVTDNTDSVDFKFFKRRHWGGYHFPRHWNLFNHHSLSIVAEKTGFEIERLTTIISPVNWVYSIHNTLVDWKMPKWLISRFTLKSIISLSVFTAIDFVFQKFGKGALLQATLRKSLDEIINS
jgi:2-polyprenyl-3-methyl-5-hydroxy-6-metoxy-1,4-benzoquinol methylase